MIAIRVRHVRALAAGERRRTTHDDSRDVGRMVRALPRHGWLGKLAVPTITVEPMDFTDCRVTSAEPDADWEIAIAHGGPAVGLSSEMPAFGDSLSPDQVRAFVSHIRTFCRESGWPPGNMNVPRPIFTEKAFPENEFVLLPAVWHDRAEVQAIHERRFAKRGMWEVAVPIRNDGIDEVELAVKYVLQASLGASSPPVSRS